MTVSELPQKEYLTQIQYFLNNNKNNKGGRLGRLKHRDYQKIEGLGAVPQREEIGRTLVIISRHLKN
jgi:hypothetical protein